MIVIGIDPGIEKTGIGIVELKNQNFNLVLHQLIRTSSKDSNGSRIKKIYDDLSAILKNNKIDSASIEKLFFSKNVKTAMIVSEVRGIILLALAQNNIPINEYTPLQLKQGLVGYGRGEKRQVQEVVKLILNIKDMNLQDDVADGIALAILHLNISKTMSKIKG